MRSRPVIVSPEPDAGGEDGEGEPWSQPATVVAKNSTRVRSSRRDICRNDNVATQLSPRARDMKFIAPLVTAVTLAAGGFQTGVPPIRSGVYVNGLETPVAFIPDPTATAVFFAVEQT